MQAVRIGWAPQEDLLPDPQGAAAGQDGTQPAPLTWTASGVGALIPGPPVPAWGTSSEGPADALAEPKVASSGAAMALPEASVGFPALRLADARQGPGALREAARGGDPGPNPEQGPAAAGPARFHVFVGNLPGDATDAGLLGAFHGLPVLEARVMRDHASGRSKGFGFLGFPCAPQTLDPVAFLCALAGSALPCRCCGETKTDMQAPPVRPRAASSCARRCKKMCASFLGGWSLKACDVCSTQESAAQAIVLMNGVYLGHNRMRCSWATQKQVLATPSPTPLSLPCAHGRRARKTGRGMQSHIALCTYC